MKFILICIWLLSILRASNLDEEKDYDIVDEEHSE